MIHVSTARFSRIALFLAAAAFGILAFMAFNVPFAHAGTWQYKNTDYSDLQCTPGMSPYSGGAYSGIPTCSANPEGKTCDRPCKINRIYSDNGTQCIIQTDIYECVPDPVEPPPLPDLVGRVGGAVNASVNQAATLYGSVLNAGGGAAGAFSNIIWVCDAGCATVNVQLDAGNVSSLASTESAILSASYTPTQVKQLYYAVCVDSSGSVAESDEGNNCSGWQLLNVNEQQNVQPIGSLDAAECSAGGVGGWAYDPDEPNTPIGVHFYVGSTLVGSVTANQYRADLGAYGNAQHAFSWSLPESYKNGNTYTLTAYAIDSSGGTNPSIGSRAFTCASVTESGEADLWVSAPVAPTSATTNVPVMFWGSVTNVGTLTSQNFPLLFQVQENGSLFSSGYMAGLAPNAYASGNASHVFSAPGTYHVRACANYNQNWIAIAPESNYANNCGPWTTVVVSGDDDEGGGSTGYLDYTTCEVAGGWAYDADVPNQALEVHLYVDGILSGATTANVYRSDLGAYGNGQHGFTWAIPERFKDGTAHSLRAYAIDGNGGPNPELINSPRTFQCEPTITWCTAGTAELKIEAVPNRVRARNSVELTWSASGVKGEGTLCRVTGPGVSWSQAVSPALSCSASGFARPTIYTQSTYTLTCGSDSKSVTVNVVPNFQEF